MTKHVKITSNTATTPNYVEYGLKDVERELITKIGSRVTAAPAILVNLGTGESGVIAETADGDIVMDNLDTGERVWGTQNVLQAVLESWGKSL